MLDKNLIQIDVFSTTQHDVFEYLAQLVVTHQYAANASDVVEALKSREAEGTTGMMDGFAIPHAKSSAISKPGISVLKLTQAVEWDAMDGQPIKYVFALFIPESQAGTTHLKLLSQMARLLMRKEFKEAFTKATTADEIYQLLQQSIEVE